MPEQVSGKDSSERDPLSYVRGFLSVDIPGLPSQLKAEIDRAVEQSDQDMMM